MKKGLLATGLLFLTLAVLFTGVSAIQNNVRAGANSWGDAPLNWRTFRSYRFENKIPEEANFYRRIDRKVQTPIAKFDYFSNRLAGGDRVDAFTAVVHHPRQYVFASLVAYALKDQAKPERFVWIEEPVRPKQAYPKYAEDIPFLKK